MLVTARPGVPLPLGSTRVPVGPYPRETALLRLAEDLCSQGRYVQLGEVDALAADLGHLPLALSRAAAWPAESGLSCADYRDRLAQRTGSGADPLTACW
ncbi:hypothetical protein [Streptomyces sp. NPDC001153]